MKKFKSHYPDHPQHGLYEDDPYDDHYSDREPGRNYVTAIIAVILVAVLVITALAEVQ